MSQFDQMTADSHGKTNFILCPHHADSPDAGLATTRFVNLLDTPGRVVILVLCGVCCNDGVIEAVQENGGDE